MGTLVVPLHRGGGKSRVIHQAQPSQVSLKPWSAIQAASGETSHPLMLSSMDSDSAHCSPWVWSDAPEKPQTPNPKPERTGSIEQKYIVQPHPFGREIRFGRLGSSHGIRASGSPETLNLNPELQQKTKPQKIPNPKPKALNLKPEAPKPKNPKPQTLSPNPKPQAQNPKLSKPEPQNPSRAPPWLPRVPSRTR